MKQTLITGIAAVAFSVTSMAAMAADTTLTISSWAPPTHGVNAIIWPELTKMMEDATDGRVSAEVKYGLGAPPAQFDLVLDGAADITWIFHGYSPGRFVSTKMIELPGYEGNAEAASVASWRAYEKFFAGLGEHKGVKVLAMMTHGPGVLHSNAKVTSLDDVSGMKLRLGGGVSGDVGAALGATGIRVPAPKVYETLDSNAADGVMMPMEAKKSFKLFEVAKNTYDVPGGFYRGSFAIIMNQNTFDGMSDADRAALEDVFGEALSRMAGQAWDQIDAAGMESLKEHADNTFTTASPEEAAKWQALTGPLIEKVIAEVAEKGVDARAAHTFIHAQMAAE
ncbi:MULTISPECIES: TRAP transporter substrate-binding protein [Phaeobacter]|uniref:TRAP transporter substrate-binding protein n=1 Tax=Phaeobacter TaxID=302485 RepID=UPI003A89DA70